MAIAFIDLNAQRRFLGSRIDEAVMKVINSGQYIMGPEIAQLESDLSAFCGAKHTLSCANGTDALSLILMAKGVGPGDAVICPSFTFAATAEVVALERATPIFVDVNPETFNVDPESLKAGIETAKQRGLKPVGFIAVDLFGQPADYDALEPICKANNLWLLSDAAQSFGATYKGRKVGTIGFATATSFFPAKPLGCYGDGGAVFTDDPALLDTLKSLRIHGQGTDKYDNIRIGINGRLDTVQAAVLIEKLKIFSEEIVKRNEIASGFNEALKDVAIVPRVLEGCVSTWAQYTIRVKAGKRDAIAAALREKGVPTAIYYPKPLHQQTAYKAFPAAGNGLPNSDMIAHEVLSLPMHPYMDDVTFTTIVDAAREAIKAA
ncbi:MAG: DegT/DnrJ/EryC1/StrS family aminotransferase [Hyphomonadaceae bacterium]|nr:DegT/DnrJ/EryC1/StrS family aminotransferase [Hyphomonadaceae bacterium]